MNKERYRDSEIKVLTTLTLSLRVLLFYNIKKHETEYDELTHF